MSGNELIEPLKALAPIIIPILVVFGIVLFFFLVLFVAVILMYRGAKKAEAHYSDIARKTAWVYSLHPPSDLKPFFKFIQNELRPRTINLRNPECFLR